MKDFKDLKTTAAPVNFIGDKITMKKILNLPIVVHGYKIEDSKADKNKGKYLTLQIMFDKNFRIVFTGGQSLMHSIKQITEDQMPFNTTIVENNERFEFT